MSAARLPASLPAEQPTEKPWQHLTASMQGLVLFSRLGVYIPLPGVDVSAFAASIKTEGLLGYIDTLSGGSISRVGIFSLGPPKPITAA